MTTARTIIKKAMLKVGILTKTEEPSADEANDALDALNAMLSSWSNDAMLIYARTLENFPLVAGTATYTIGSSQTFNTTRPIFIVDSFVRSGSVDYDLTTITDERYNAIELKTVQGIPEFINYTNGYPAGTIKLYPVPASNYTLYLNTEKELTSFTLDATVSLPPGWEQALIYNLAVLLAPEYGQEISQAVYQIAQDSKGAIKTAIMRNRTMDANPPVNGTNNIYAGWTR
jgi:hypothetical protein